MKIQLDKEDLFNIQQELEQIYTDGITSIDAEAEFDEESDILILRFFDDVGDAVKRYECRVENFSSGAWTIEYWQIPDKIPDSAAALVRCQRYGTPLAYADVAALGRWFDQNSKEDVSPILWQLHGGDKMREWTSRLLADEAIKVKGNVLSDRQYEELAVIADGDVLDTLENALE